MSDKFLTNNNCRNFEVKSDTSLIRHKSTTKKLKSADNNRSKYYFIQKLNVRK